MLKHVGLLNFFLFIYFFFYILCFIIFRLKELWHAPKASPLTDKNRPLKKNHLRKSRGIVFQARRGELCKRAVCGMFDLHNKTSALKSQCTHDLWQYSMAIRQEDRHFSTHNWGIFFPYKLPKTVTVTTWLLFGHVTLLCGIFIFYLVEWRTCLVIRLSDQHALDTRSPIYNGQKT